MLVDEAPVFYPTPLEFNLGPIDYIAKIRSQAEKYGICKIVPPKTFRPPFAVDPNHFKFTPRVQRLNELEASVRAKLNFLDQLYKFWELQACKIKIPYIDGRPLDLHQLHRCVRNEGGFEACVCEKRWSKVSQLMGFHSTSRNKGTVASLLRHHYEKLLYPYDIFLAGEAKINQHEFGFVPSQNLYTFAEFEGMANQFKSNYFKQPSGTQVPLEVVEKEYWRLASSLEDNVCVEYGADLSCNDFGSGFPTRPKQQQQQDTQNPNKSDYNSVDREHRLLTSNHHNTTANTTTAINKHENDEVSKNINDYIDHPWNLNNIPIADGSVFKYINTNISGMILPWMYVGMCFSTFCWHNEDHWTYSINYLHYGDAKTWYGVPGPEAETFERSMKRVAPDLFKSQPDLLHQLVTICNPTSLIEDKVPIYRVHQFTGEFVVTFPRAYHTGFNQGLNCAEAVNFAPADWLKLGRECIENYSSLRRFPVFSQDELMCKIASNPSNLNYTTAIASLQDIVDMIETEIELRSETFDWGVVKSERHMFENFADDERQCRVCKTTCFLSALSCQCTDEASDCTKLVCLNHKESLCCKCKPRDHTLKFRYTLDELPVLHRRLSKHVKLLESSCKQQVVAAATSLISASSSSSSSTLSPLLLPSVASAPANVAASVM